MCAQLFSSASNGLEKKIVGKKCNPGIYDLDSVLCTCFSYCFMYILHLSMITIWCSKTMTLELDMLPSNTWQW